MSARCLCCGAEPSVPSLDLGRQPLCNRYLAAPGAEEDTYPLVYGQCPRCGLVQALCAAPAAAVRPRFDWVSYQEPEAHLDSLVETISALPGLTSESVICGLSYKDETTLRRLAGRGFRNTWLIDPVNDLGLAGRAEIETIQDRLRPEALTDVAARRPRPALVVARHILEHVHDPASFFAAMRRLAAPRAYLVFESPECGRALRALDYTVLWEEHLMLFTPTTFRRFFPGHGFRVHQAYSYPYACEDSLVAVVEPEVPAGATELGETGATELADFSNFRDAFPERRERVRRTLAEFREQEGKIALLGAGHAACTFLNLHGLREFVSFVADDNPRKIGLFMPGSGLPILPSALLLEEEIRLCLLAVSPSAESRVRENNRDFTARGGVFASIHPQSPSALTLMGEAGT
jgi:hypothetical protein